MGGSRNPRLSLSLLSLLSILQARPKIYAELTGGIHNEPKKDGLLNQFDAHFLACHTAGIQSSCDRIYGSGPTSLCQANNYTKCEITK